ncbi:glycosyltransferase family 2 protein [Planotetraspora kaengkrachanensis]|uniref:Glycosyltransferase 2-like domain-containing protein n=1 Tax=Planotetraspora kaengkrachanensis TaxID=575193 RepID=A0A8J3M911_9ACTN|nr:glycosyltransferase family 2 protein [Planotetraspora kaengkrachanensis]GIG80265.1 hypothetical protein Pka01_33920 [Planotetraspora kaengkrachanensis]
MGVKVSVVVPVFNPGLADDAFGACVRSLLEQSLPPEEYEVIFVDDGSTDGARDRLDAMAANRPNVRVLHLDHSGSLARVRNMGLSAARGDYVYLMNQRDRLESAALEHMYGMAVEADADVLVGRVVDGGPPLSAFAGNQPRADVLRDHLLALPTAHKLFNREFVEALQLRFPDRPLSEPSFVTRAYLAAKVVAILAEEICCHLGPSEDDSPDPEALFDGLHAILDVVDAHTGPGRQRDRVYAHWYRALGLRRLGGSRFLAASEDERTILFSLMYRLTVERFPPALDAYLPVHLRARVALLRHGRLQTLVELAAASQGTRLRAELRDVRWEQSVLALDLGVEIVRADGSPLWFREEGGRLFWTPTVPMDGLLDQETADVTDAADKARMEVYIRDAETGVMYFLPVTSTVDRDTVGDQVRVRASGEARLDVGSAALGRPLRPGVWEVHVRMRGVHPCRTRVARPDAPMNCAGILAEDPRRLVVPCWSERGELGVCVEPKSFPDSIALVSSKASVARQEGHVFVVVPVPYVPPSGGPPAELVLRQGDGRGRSTTVPAFVEPGIPGRLAGQLIAKVPVSRTRGDDSIGPGSWRPSLRIDEKDVDLLFGLAVGRGGQVRVLPAGTRPAPSFLRRIARRVLRYRPSR